MKRLAAMALSVAMFATLVAGLKSCAGMHPPYYLCVSVSSWSGLDPVGNWDERDYVVDIWEGTAFYMKEGVTGGLGFLVLEIDEQREQVTIQTGVPMALDEGKGVDLATRERVFTIRYGEETRLTTPTMDAGTTYCFTLS